MTEQKHTRLRERWFFRWAWERNDSWRGPYHELNMPGAMAAFVVGILTACVVIGAVIAVIVIPITVSECHQGAERQGTTGSYQFPSGCYYRLPDGNELPAGEYPAKRLHIEGSLR